MLKHHDVQHRRHDGELPELPADVVVPDDASSLTIPPDVRADRAARNVRWLWWIPVVALLSTGAVALAIALRDDAPATEVADVAGVDPAYVQIQDEIDRALVEFRAEQASRPAYVQIQDEIDRALDRQAIARANRPAYLLVQDEIDRALNVQAIAQANRPAYLLVQDEIDRALNVQAIRRDLDARAAALDQPYLIVEREIERALAEFRLEQAESTLPAYLQIERAIERALAETVA